MITDTGRYTNELKSLEGTVAGLAKVAQGLILHQHIHPIYGVKVPEDRMQEVQIRPVEKTLERVCELDARPFSIAREPLKRAIGNCRHFTVLHTAMLRLHGFKARARCGFASYFDRNMFVDHWVTELWDEDRKCWIRSDAQLDEAQQKNFKIDFDPLDVPTDRFLTGGAAWLQCRSGRMDPMKFGIMQMKGLWFIAGDLIRDFAALNDVEMLPWDVWGAMPKPEDAISENNLAFFDHLARLTATPDESMGEIRKIYNTDDRVRVPATI